MKEGEEENEEDETSKRMIKSMKTLMM